ncbi:General transcription factor II-I repeat domain-containing protein 2 [Acipenser ruthenus]|uniref:General transcription factor II-I repeat domain-containing protein 2 n=1 Tax=Acipenser ruthenus TaxID=7906 RepID=A0A444UCB4_ACIRT|nr:General transcription factor II-I repeat domain-containing protein 2 [Acipenser ruthenus]
MLNLKLQGKDKILPTLLSDVSAFEAKLALFSDQLLEKDLTHFQVLNSQVTQLHDPAVFLPEPYTEYLSEVSREFSSRFSDMKPLTSILSVVENPFFVDVKTASVTAEKFGVNKSTFQEEFLELQHNNVLKAKHQEVNSEAFWMCYILNETHPAIVTCAKKVLTCFGSTYACESAFSSMGTIKTKHRTCLSDRHLNDCLRAAKTRYQPHVKKMVKAMQTQSSH